MNKLEEEFTELAILLSENNETLSDVVQLSLGNPTDYIQKYSKELQDRGINEPTDILPWIALIDGLNRMDKLSERDWKESGEMFIKATIKLLEKGENTEPARISLNSLIIDSNKVPNILRNINLALQPFGYAVVVIDIDSDCYPVALIKLHSAPSIIRVANRIKPNRVLYFQ